MDHYEIQGILLESSIIFVLATTDQSDCPPYIKKVCRSLLEKNSAVNLWENLK